MKDFEFIRIMNETHRKSRNKAACFVCGYYYRANVTRRTLHTIPKDPKKFKKWQEVLPKEGFTSDSKVCSKHFKETDYINNIDVITSKGSFYVPNTYLKLREGAVPDPSLIFNSEVFLVKAPLRLPISKQTLVPIQQTPLSKPAVKSTLQKRNVFPEMNHSPELAFSLSISVFNHFWDYVDAQILPNQRWTYCKLVTESGREIVFSEIMKNGEDQIRNIRKQVVLSTQNVFKYFIHSEKMTSEQISMRINENVFTIKSLQSLLSEVDKAEVSNRVWHSTTSSPHHETFQDEDIAEFTSGVHYSTASSPFHIHQIKHEAADYENQENVANEIYSLNGEENSMIVDEESPLTFDSVKIENVVKEENYTQELEKNSGDKFADISESVVDESSEQKNLNQALSLKSKLINYTEESFPLQDSRNSQNEVYHSSSTIQFQQYEENFLTQNSTIQSKQSSERITDLQSKKENHSTMEYQQSFFIKVESKDETMPNSTIEQSPDSQNQIFTKQNSTITQPIETSCCDIQNEETNSGQLESTVECPQQSFVNNAVEILNKQQNSTITQQNKNSCYDHQNEGSTIECPQQSCVNYENQVEILNNSTIAQDNSCCDLQNENTNSDQLESTIEYPQQSFVSNENAENQVEILNKQQQNSKIENPCDLQNKKLTIEFSQQSLTLDVKFQQKSIIDSNEIQNLDESARSKKILKCRFEKCSDVYFPNTKNQKDHLITHHNYKQCFWCKKVFTSLVQLKHHQNLKHFEKCASVPNLRCHLCDVFSTDLIRHQKKEHFRCKACVEFFIDEFQLARHYCFAHKQLLTTEKFLTFKEIEQVRLRNGIVEWPYACYQCSTFFKSTNRLNEHIKHLHLKLYFCTVCNFRSRDKFRFDQHIQRYNHFFKSKSNYTYIKQ